MSGSIFVSYRRDDSKHAAGRLVDRLLDEFDQDQLFLDVDNIEPGLDFIEVINERVAACDVMLVIIGPHWLNATSENGARRLDDPKDFVRLEVQAALDRKIRVIPLLVDGAAPVRADELPESLAPLANRQTTRLAHESFSDDIERLTRVLAKIVERDSDHPRETRPQPGGQMALTEPDGVAPETAAAISRHGFDVLGWVAVLSPWIAFAALVGLANNTSLFQGPEFDYFIAFVPVAFCGVVWTIRLLRQPPVSVAQKLTAILMLASYLTVMIIVFSDGSPGSFA